MYGICPSCKGKMKLLFTSFYCPNCEKPRDNKRDDGLTWRHPDQCPHEKSQFYTYDGHEWCRACGKHMRKVS